jgi:tRNA (mo5U34)-methyltransferase
MPASWPHHPAEFLQLGCEIQAHLRNCKARTPLLDYGWYPYESLAALPVVAELIAPVYEQLGEAIRSKPVADLGCGDGDWAVLFSNMGADVDAIDHRESNFNQMRGLEALRRISDVPVQVHDVNLDGRITLPRRDYGLMLFLGTLYHLKNPYYVLETLSSHGDSY